MQNYFLEEPFPVIIIVVTEQFMRHIPPAQFKYMFISCYLREVTHLLGIVRLSTNFISKLKESIII
jgi:hypothetical protein